MDKAMLQLHLDDWEHYFPRIRTSLVIPTPETWGIVVPTDTDTTNEQHEDAQWAPLSYPNLTEF